MNLIIILNVQLHIENLYYYPSDKEEEAKLMKHTGQTIVTFNDSREFTIYHRNTFIQTQDPFASCFIGFHIFGPTQRSFYHGFSQCLYKAVKCET